MAGPLRKFTLTDGSRPQFSQLSNSYLPHENALSFVAKSYSVLYQSCTLIAPIFAHLQLSALPDF